MELQEAYDEIKGEIATLRKDDPEVFDDAITRMYMQAMGIGGQPMGPSPTYGGMPMNTGMPMSTGMPMYGMPVSTGMPMGQMGMDGMGRGAYGGSPGGLEALMPYGGSGGIGKLLEKNGSVTIDVKYTISTGKAESKSSGYSKGK